MAYGHGAQHPMFIAKTESFWDKMLAKGHDLSLGLRQLVQFGLNFGILIRNLMIVNCFVHGRSEKTLKARRGWDEMNLETDGKSHKRENQRTSNFPALIGLNLKGQKVRN